MSANRNLESTYQPAYRPGRALATLGLLFSTAGVSGCSDEDLRAFRAAAASELEQGVGAIFEGVVSGAFAIFNQGTDSTDTTTDTSGSTSGDETTTP